MCINLEAREMKSEPRRRESKPACQFTVSGCRDRARVSRVDSAHIVYKINRENGVTEVLNQKILKNTLKMALLNFSHPFPVSPPFFTQHGYTYPRPPSAFTAEEVTQPPPVPLTPPTYTKVQAGTGSKTRIHAVIDYDDDYYDDGDPNQNVTPLQGPILLKNGSVPVVPLYSYPQVNNGTFVQIPILWTALSLALGVELRGNLIRGVPCYKRDYQLYCPTAGNTYPIDRIELFIDENKALMKRMYGEFSMNSPPDYNSAASPGTKSKRSVKPGVPDLHAAPGPDPVFDESETMFGKNREVRQNFNFRNKSESGRIDACESRREVISPFWLNNTQGSLRAIVNTQGFEQSIDQEVCSKNTTSRCSDDCGCEQNYKFIRLLSYDPSNDCKGIFMDWYRVESCCICRCELT
nr:protein spaetzle 3 isoform X2 [Onthophagus taurus]